MLRGGPSSEYEVSLKSGASVLEHLDREKYEPRDVFITRRGEWHHGGVPMLPERALRGVDVAFNAMHGEFGEDGGVQRLLEVLKIPYTGSNAAASSLAFNKQRTRNAVTKLGIKVPQGIVVSKTPDVEKAALQIFRSFPHPAIVKPVVGGSSVGITIADNFHALLYGLEQAFEIAPKALVEEFISGSDATVGVIDHFRNEKTYALLPIPDTFTRGEKDQLIDLAKTVHINLNLSHYSRSDFVVSKRGIYFLEVNTLPGLTKESLLPKALQAIGSKLSEFLDHVISLAKGKR